MKVLIILLAMTASAPAAGAADDVPDQRCTGDAVEPDARGDERADCAPRQATSTRRLMHAIAHTDIAGVRASLADGASPDAVVDGNTPLMLASKIGDIPIIDMLLAAGAHVDNALPDAERRTPLMVAITSDNADVVALLLAHGASVARKDHRDLDALDHAARTDGRLGGERYTLLVSAPFNPVFAGGGTRVPGPTGAARAAARRELMLVTLHGELQSAARACHVLRLAVLLRRQGDLASPELVDGEPLATRTRGPACRRQLLDHLQTKRSYRQAHAAHLRAAVARCNTPQVDALLLENDDLDVLDGTGDRPAPFEQAILAGCTDIASLMIRARDLRGRLVADILLQAIRLAPRESLMPLVGALLAAGADVNARDAERRTPLAEAIAREQPRTARFLVDAGADVQAPTAEGSYPIVEASAKGYRQLVMQLVREGADIESRDADGRTALLAAVAGNHGELVDSLVEAGADVYRRDARDLDAVLLAESLQLPRIRALLLKIR